MLIIFMFLIFILRCEVSQSLKESYKITLHSKLTIQIYNTGFI